MNNRRVFPLLLITFLVLAVAAVLQTTLGGSSTTVTPSPPAEETESPLTSGTLLRVFPDLAVLDITAIRIENPAADQSLTFARDASGTWSSSNSDAQSASDIARSIVLLPYGRSINLTPETDLSLYGLAPTPQYLISLVLQNDESHVIAVGKVSDSAPVYFALVDERDEILEIERGAIDFVTNFLN